MGDFYIRVCAASKRSQRRTLKWARQIQFASSPESLAKDNSRWEDLDTALAVAVLEIARGPVKRELLLFQELMLRKGEPLCGRSAVFILLRRYHIDSGTQMQMDLTSVMSLKYEGDLEIYLDKLDFILLEADTAIPEQFLYAIIEPELRKCKELAADFVYLDSTDDGDPRRTSSSLYEVARKVLTRMQRMSMREALTGKGNFETGLIASRADGGKGEGGKANRPCIRYARGNCNYGDKFLFAYLGST
jgi:hypothetical protein